MGISIAWSRLSMYCDFHPAKSTQGYVEERTAFFKELIRRGHSITLYTPMTINSEKLMEGVKKGNVTEVLGLDVTWMKHLKYKPSKVPKNKDVLVVESSAPNFMFDDKVTKGLQIRRAVEIIDAHKGLVILEHNDPDLPFPLYKMGLSKYDWNHKKNMYRIETKNNTYDAGKYNLKNYDNKEPYGWGTFKEMFENKKYVLMTKSLNAKKVAEEYEGSRSKYSTIVKKGLMEVVSFPTAYDKEYINSLELEFNDNPEFDVLYTGYPRNREKYFEQYFCDMPRKLKMALTGPWNDKRKELYFNTNVTYLGHLHGFLSMPQASNNSKVVLQLAVKKAKQFEWVTSRHLEAVLSGAVVLYDSDYTCMRKYLGEELALFSHDDAIRKYLWIKKLKPEKRYELWKYQYDRCKKYDWKWYVTRFEKLCAKHGIDVKPKKLKKRSKEHCELGINILARLDKVKVAKFKIAKRVKQKEATRGKE